MTNAQIMYSAKRLIILSISGLSHLIWVKPFDEPSSIPVGILLR